MAAAVPQSHELHPNVAFGIRYAETFLAAEKLGVAEFKVRDALHAAASFETTEEATELATESLPTGRQFADRAYRRFLRIYESATPEDRRILEEEKNMMDRNHAHHDFVEARATLDQVVYHCSGCQRASVVCPAIGIPVTCCEVVANPSLYQAEDEDTGDTRPPHMYACEARFCDIDCRNTYVMLHAPDCRHGVYGYTHSCERLVNLSDRVTNGLARHANRAAEGKDLEKDAESSLQRDIGCLNFHIERGGSRRLVLGANTKSQAIFLKALQEEVAPVPLPPLPPLPEPVAPAPAVGAAEAEPKAAVGGKRRAASAKPRGARAPRAKKARVVRFVRPSVAAVAAAAAPAASE